MSHTALRSVTDAIDATREFLFEPFTWKRWLAMALIVFFAGGSGGSFNPTNFQSAQNPQAQEGFPSGDPLQELQTFVETNPEQVTIILAILGVVLALGLFFGWISAVLQFVFVESLRTDEIHLTSYFSRFSGKGLRLFGFQAVLSLVTFAIAGAGAYVAYRQYWGSLDLSFGVLAALAVVAALVFAVVSLVQSFTVSFVVPTMLVEDRGVLSAWGRFWPVLKASWLEYLLFLLVGGLISLALGVVAFIVMMVLLFVLAIPFFVLLLVGSLAGPAGLVLAVPLAILFGLLVLLIAALVRVPFATYLRYYALLVLGDTDSDLDPIPDVRARIRENRTDLGGDDPGVGGA